MVLLEQVIDKELYHANLKVQNHFTELLSELVSALSCLIAFLSFMFSFCILKLSLNLLGKTLLAKAVANQTSATFLRVVGSELIQKYLVSLHILKD